MTTKEDLKKSPLQFSDNNKEDSRHLILHNDDVHTFDYVIEALIDICKHDYIQASQCSVITHFKGKCDVSSGSYKQLKPLKEALINLELIATID